MPRSRKSVSMANIKKIIAESKKCQDNSDSRKAGMIEFITGYVRENGQTKSAEFLGMDRPNLSKILASKRQVSEAMLLELCEKILKSGKKI